MQRIREELSKLAVNNQLRRISDIDTKIDGKVIIDGREYVNFASNDYLGISTKNDLIKEFSKTGEYLYSSASARLLSGTSREFKELENTVANIFNKEGCLIFNTGYQCNLGVISALCSRGDVIFSDKLNHASIIDGMRLSEGDFVRYKHHDYDGLERLLKRRRDSYKRAIIVSESVYSMDGDVADIQRLVELKNKYDCLLMIDEAHAFCTYGKSLAGVSTGMDVDIITATFGKAVGSFGAFCVANSDIINYLINKARSFIFSTSIPPVNIAWTNWLLGVNRGYLEERKEILNKLADQAHELMGDKGTHIIPIITGSNENTLKISEKLRSEGYYIPAIRPPTVPDGTSRLRISLTADSKIEDFKRVLEIVREF